MKMVGGKVIERVIEEESMKREKQTDIWRDLVYKLLRGRVRGKGDLVKKDKKKTIQIIFVCTNDCGRKAP